MERTDSLGVWLPAFRRPPASLGERARSRYPQLRMKKGGGIKSRRGIRAEAAAPERKQSYNNNQEENRGKWKFAWQPLRSPRSSPRRRFICFRAVFVFAFTSVCCWKNRGRLEAEICSNDAQNEHGNIGGGRRIGRAIPPPLLAAVT